MSDRTPGLRGNPSQERSAGPPNNLAVLQRPSDEELDRRDREKAKPRRPAGPPLRDDVPASAPRNAPPHTPPLPTEPVPGPPSGGPAEQGPKARLGATRTSAAGRPADFVGPKPSSDDLDRRDRLKAGPRRAAGPPLRDVAPMSALRAAQTHTPPAPTEPKE